MTEAWIIGSPGDLVAAIDRALAQLGYQPRLATPHEPLVAAGAPASTDGPADAADELGLGPSPAAGPGRTLSGATRLPALLVLVDEVERVAERISGDDELSRLPLLVVADGHRLSTGAYSAVGHELIMHPFSEGELETRIARARYAALGPESSDVVTSGTLELNTATYQVRVDGRPIDFTYMEYELLKFLVTHPDRVFSREALLSNVWGYDYYGGARTVDVHIRRLRAKLGHEHAERIRTLRSVGYRWDGSA